MNMIMTQVQKSDFSFDNKMKFEGYTAGDITAGRHDMPMFTRAVSEEIIKYHHQIYPRETPLEYDEASDSFKGKYSRYRGFYVIFREMIIKVYNIGNVTWYWKDLNRYESPYMEVLSQPIIWDAENETYLQFHYRIMGYVPYENAQDKELVAKSRCLDCGGPLKYVGVRKGGLYVAINYCPNCEEDYLF
jgi:hypothetical protein